MKRIVIVIALLGLTMAVHAQQIIIKGKYNGQMMTVKAQRAPGGDIIESVTYAPLTDLKKEVAALKKQRDEYEKKYRDALKNGGKTDDKVVDSLNAMNRRLKLKEQEMNVMQHQVDSLRTQLQNSKEAYERLKQENGQMTAALSQANRTKEKMKNRDMLGLHFTLGGSFIENDLIGQDFWSQQVSLSQRYQATYTHYFSREAPLALKVGLGYGTYRTKASFQNVKDSIVGIQDIDGDLHDTRYDYRNVEEQLSMNYLELPIAVHLGNNSHALGVKAWAEIGISIGLNLNNTFVGKGNYSAEGYYSNWNIVLRDIPELGYVSDDPIYGNELTSKVNKVVLWGNVAAGLFIPLGGSFGINLGIRGDYTLSPVATHDVLDRRYIPGEPNLLAGRSTRIIALTGEIGLLCKF